MKFSEQVLELRMHLQITQKQLAELLQVAYPTISRWEMGHYEATKLMRRKFDNLCKQHGLNFGKTEAVIDDNN